MISFKYRDKDTPVHQLNPLVKIAWVLSLFIAVLIIDNPLFSLGFFLSTLPFVFIGNIWKEWISLIKLGLIISAAIIVINPLVNYNGSTVLAEAPYSLPLVGAPAITLEAIIFGLGMAMKLMVIISVFGVLTLTVDPDNLMRSFLKLKLPYKPVLVTSLSARFVPTLVSDIERITDAQRTRGVEFDKGRIFNRIRRSAFVLIPLLSNSLDRAYQISEAMEARGFGNGRKRTSYNEVATNSIDLFIIVLALVPLALVIFLIVAGYGSYEYYPMLEDINLNIVEWVTVFMLPILAAAPAFLSLLKRKINLDKNS